MEILLIAVLWIALAALVGYAAQAKGQDGGGATLIAIIFSPVVGFLWVLALPDKGAELRHAELLAATRAAKDDTRECPRCAESIKRAASFCRFCNAEVARLPAALHPTALKDSGKTESAPAGAGTISYLGVALIVALILVVIIGGISQLGTSANATFNTVSSAM